MVTLSVPGKTFFCGEYLALLGGSTLLLSTGPRFQLKVDLRGDRPQTDIFHPKSPAGLYLKQYEEYFSKYHFEFVNPYKVGGFGGSTAEYLLLNAVHQFGEGLWTEHQLDLDVRKALYDYRDLPAESALKPSGADLVAQACGSVTAFERRSGRIEVLSWPFTNLSFVLFSTGNKLPTHTHLPSLTPAALDTFEALEEPCRQVWDAFVKGSEGQALIGLNEVASTLRKLGLQNENSMKLCNELSLVPGVRAVKGCGAMGSDVILVVFDKREARLSEVVAIGEQAGLTKVATDTDLTYGLEKDLAVHANPIKGLRL